LNIRHLTNMTVKPGATGEPGKTRPLRLELTDGTICVSKSGSGPTGVPGYPYWAGYCSGPSAGTWRVGETDRWKNDQEHFALYPAANAGGYWQVAISVGAEAAPAQLFDVRTVYR
jgi:hypothetical protein